MKRGRYSQLPQESISSAKPAAFSLITQFTRFLDLELEDPVLDATTIWLFREALVEAGLIDKLFARFGQHLEAAGHLAHGGQIIDATIVSVPKQRNTKEENEAIKAGKRPEGWEPTKPQNGPDRGTHPGASAATTRSYGKNPLNRDIFRGSLIKSAACLPATC